MTEFRTLRRKLHQEVELEAEPGFPTMGPHHYLPFLESLHAQLNPRVYFEIGTESGASLGFARCTSIAVDPAFRLQGDVSRGKPELHLYQGTSDDFFASRLVERLGLRIDLAFLDGMHLFEFLLRDFINTERLMDPQGAILLHDCVPFNHAVAARDWDRTLTRSWTGDVWKMIPILRELRPDLTVEVLDLAPTGLVAVTGLDPASTQLASRYDEIVARYGAVTLAEHGLDRFAQEVALVRYAPPASSPRPARQSSGVIAIKTCVPRADERESWGDYHFARSLAAAFERLGRPARVDLMADWSTAPPDDALDIVLQGHDFHPPRAGIPAILWMIYPGKRFDHGQVLHYDHVFVASSIFARKLRRRVPGLAPSVLYQAFDPAIMRPSASPGRAGFVFVGNNHFGAEDRPTPTYARRGGHPLRLWGRGWDGPGWEAHLEAPVLANHEVGPVYADARAVLCDHTKVMARNGFLSNRVFDALACAAPVITDEVGAMPEGFAELVHVADGQARFDAAAAEIAAEGPARRAERLDFARTMVDLHSFDTRARQILDKAEELSLI